MNLGSMVRYMIPAIRLHLNMSYLRVIYEIFLPCNNISAYTVIPIKWQFLYKFQVKSFDKFTQADQWINGIAISTLQKELQFFKKSNH